MAKGDKKSGAARNETLAPLREAVHALEESVVCDVVRDACARVHDLLVSTVSEVVSKQAPALAGQKLEKSTSGGAEWSKISSLSEIRRLVGGRFQNLKNRWIGAGFPLREHRGDRAAEFEVIPKGWDELSSWLLSQGFESRLAQDKDGTLFEIRMLK